MAADDETAITDIELLPDGRIFVFGASRQVLELLRDLENPSDSIIAARLSHLNSNDVLVTPLPQTPPS